MNVKSNWIDFQLSQIKGTICKIRKVYKEYSFLEKEIE